MTVALILQGPVTAVYVIWLFLSILFLFKSRHFLTCRQMCKSDERMEFNLDVSVLANVPSSVATVVSGQMSCLQLNKPT